MINDHIGGIRDPSKQDQAHEFDRNQNEVISILTETHINHDQIHYIRSNWLGPIFFSPGVTQKDSLSCFIWVWKYHWGWDWFVSFKVTPSNDRVLSVYTPSGYSNREHLSSGRFFEGLQHYMGNKNEGNENKIILGDLNCTMDRMDRGGENKTQWLYRCCSDYA